MPDETRHSGGHPYASNGGSQHVPARAVTRSGPALPHIPPHAALPSDGSAAPDGFPAPPPPPAPAPLRVVVADDNPVVRAGLTVLLSGRDDIQVVAEASDGRQAYEESRRHRPDVILLDVRMPGVDGISALPHLVPIAPVMMLTYSREREIVHEALRLGAGGYLVHGEFTADQLVAAVRDTKEGRPYFTHTAVGALLDHVRQAPATAPPQSPLPDDLGTVTAADLTGRDSSAHGMISKATHSSSPSVGPNSATDKAHSVEAEPGSIQGVSRLQSVVAQSFSGRMSPNPAALDRNGFGLSSREAEIMDLIASGMNNQQIAATCFISEKTVKNHINRIFAKLHSASRGEAAAKWLGTAPGSGTGRG